MSPYLSNHSRRGLPECNEIDVLATHSNLTSAPSDPVHLESITNKLHSTGYITHHLAVEPDQYHGILQLPNHIISNTHGQPSHRHLRIRLVAWNAFIFAQLHFTGPITFVRYLRERAARQGYQLSWDKLEKRTKTAVEVFGVDGLRFMDTDDHPEGQVIVLDSEEDVFRFLKMKYVHPNERNWY